MFLSSTNDDGSWDADVVANAREKESWHARPFRKRDSVRMFGSSLDGWVSYYLLWGDMW